MELKAREFNDYKEKIDELISKFNKFGNTNLKNNMDFHDGVVHLKVDKGLGQTESGAINKALGDNNLTAIDDSNPNFDRVLIKDPEKFAEKLEQYVNILEEKSKLGPMTKNSANAIHANIENAVKNMHSTTDDVLKDLNDDLTWGEKPKIPGNN